MVDGLVSIIMPSYNTGKFIGESIESVLAQTYANWELIIVDDCSTDNTDNIVAKYNDSRIRYLKNKKNSGAAISRNYALREAKGEWIAFLDSDDLWVAEKLEKQLYFMKKNGYFFSCTGRDEIDEDSNKFGKITTTPQHVSRLGMYLYCWPGCLAVMYHAPTVGLIQIENLKKNNDYAIWLKVIKKCDCYSMNDILAHYRVRKNSISHDSFFKLLKAHYDLFRYGEKFNPFCSLILTVVNLVFGIYKKMKYVHYIKEE
jgi:glycosyltransferase involved in cell wall biosynthesis